MSKRDKYIKSINARDRQQTKDEQKQIKQLEKLYKLALKDIQKDLTDIIDSYADQEIKYSDFQKTIPIKDRNNLKKNIASYLKYIRENDPNNTVLINELNNLYKKQKVQRLEVILYELNKNINKLGLSVKTGINNMLISSIKFYHEATHTSLNDYTGQSLPYSILSNDKILKILNTSWSGMIFNKRVDKNTKELRKSLRSYVTKMLITGKSIKETAKQFMEANKHLTNDFNRSMNRHKNNAITAVRTEYNYVANQATKITYEEFDVEQYEIFAQIDSRTSVICRDIDGEIFNMDQIKVGVTYPPFHPNCRTTTLPVLQ